MRRDDHPSQPVTLILLSTKSLLTHLLVRTLHQTYSHAGISAMTSIIGHTYLIPGLRNLLKHVSRTCPQCQRAYARPLSHQMGLLPTTRTTPSPPFTVTGVNFAGPFVLCRGNTRKPVLVKCYIVIFVCLSTKSVHLDLCVSLSTEDFMATLRRFTARRGVPAHMYSDNRTNFVGARENMREIQAMIESKATRNSISHFATEQDIQWHHIPPRAPHFGGLWEAAVKSMKCILRKYVAPPPTPLRRVIYDRDRSRSHPKLPPSRASQFRRHQRGSIPDSQAQLHPPEKISPVFDAGI